MNEPADTAKMIPPATDNAMHSSTSVAADTKTMSNLKDENDHRATIFEIHGKVRMLKHGSNSWIPAKKGMIIEQGDQLFTDKKSYADIVYDPYFLNVARIEEKTKAEFRSIEPTDVFMEDGTVFSALDGLAGSSYQISTPTAVAGVRGTWFAVEAAEGLMKNVAVLRDDKLDHESIVELRFVNQETPVAVKENSQVNIAPDKSVVVGEIKPEFKAFAEKVVDPVVKQFGNMRQEGLAEMKMMAEKRLEQNASDANTNVNHKEAQAEPRDSKQENNKIGNDGNPPNGGGPGENGTGSSTSSSGNVAAKVMGGPAPANANAFKAGYDPAHFDPGKYDPGKVDAAMDSFFNASAPPDPMPTSVAASELPKENLDRTQTVTYDQKSDSKSHDLNNVAMDRVGQFLQIGAGNNSGTLDSKQLSSSTQGSFEKVFNNLFQGFTAQGVTEKDVHKFSENLGKSFDTAMNADSQKTNNTPGASPSGMAVSAGVSQNPVSFSANAGGSNAVMPSNSGAGNGWGSSAAAPKNDPMPSVAAAFSQSSPVSSGSQVSSLMAAISGNTKTDNISATPAAAAVSMPSFVSAVAAAPSPSAASFVSSGGGNNNPGMVTSMMAAMTNPASAPAPSAAAVVPVETARPEIKPDVKVDTPKPDASSFMNPMNMANMASMNSMNMPMQPAVNAADFSREASKDVAREIAHSSGDATKEAGKEIQEAAREASRQASEHATDAAKMAEQYVKQDRQELSRAALEAAASSKDTTSSSQH